MRNKVEGMTSKSAPAQALAERGTEPSRRGPPGGLAGRISQSPRMEQQHATIQALFGGVAEQREAAELKPNHTGIPAQLKTGVEALSGMSMNHVRVHYNSEKPARLNALAYAQGSEIHLGPGQERHLAHEAWHVVQQMQGRVQATMQAKSGIPVNADKGLEHEADVMAARAMAHSRLADERLEGQSIGTALTGHEDVAQRVAINLQPNDALSKLAVNYARGKLGIHDELLDSIDDEHVLSETENIYLFGHGGYSGVTEEEHDLIGRINMEDLATRLHASFTFPKKYSGTIYLIGCKTDSLLSTLKTKLDARTGKDLDIRGTTEKLQSAGADDLSLREQPETEAEVMRREVVDIQRYFYQPLINLRNDRREVLKQLRQADDFEKKKAAMVNAFAQRHQVNDWLVAIRDARESLKNVTSLQLRGKRSGFEIVQKVYEKSKAAQDQIRVCLTAHLDLYQTKPLPDNAAELEREILQQLIAVLQQDRKDLNEEIDTTAVLLHLNDAPDMLKMTPFDLGQMVDVAGARRVENLKNSRIRLNAVTDQIRGWTPTALRRTLLWKQVNEELTNPQQDWTRNRVCADMSAKITALSAYLPVLHRIQIARNSPDQLYESAIPAIRRKLDVDYDFCVKRGTFIRLLEREEPRNFVGAAWALCQQMQVITERLVLEVAMEARPGPGHGRFGLGFF